MILYYIEDSVTSLNIMTASRPDNIRGLAMLTGHKSQRVMSAKAAARIKYTDNGNQEINGKVVYIPNKLALQNTLSGMSYIVLFGAETAKMTMTAGNYVDCTLLQGVLKYQRVTSNGRQFQSFNISERNYREIEQYFINVYVNNEAWTIVDSILDMSYNQKAVMVRTGLTSGIDIFFGNGDFGKSMEIATRCGQDSDCNPATVGGVLGVMYGKSGIPEFWSKPLEPVWDSNFEGTDVSLAKGSLYSYNQALQLIERNGGKVDAQSVSIPQLYIGVLPLEQNFVDTYPVFRDQKDAWMEKEYEFDFSGNGFCIWGNLVCLRGISRDYANRVAKKHVGSEVFALAEQDDDYVAEIEVWIDGELDQVSLLPMRGTSRKLEPAWKYCLPEGRHHVKMVWRNPNPKVYLLRINAIQYYSEHPVTNPYYTKKKKKIPLHSICPYPCARILLRRHRVRQDRDHFRRCPDGQNPRRMVRPDHRMHLRWSDGIQVQRRPHSGRSAYDMV